MSLVALARQLRGPRTLTRTLLIVVTVTAGIIVGLLAMHSLNSHTAASAVTATSTVVSHAEVADDTYHRDSAAGGDAGCVDCGEHQAMLVMACVLALLVTVLLLTRPSLWWRAGTHPARAGPSAVLTCISHRARPPSLIVFCISRT